MRLQLKYTTDFRQCIQFYLQRQISLINQMIRRIRWSIWILLFWHGFCILATTDNNWRFNCFYFFSILLKALSVKCIKLRWISFQVNTWILIRWFRERLIVKWLQYRGWSFQIIVYIIRRYYISACLNLLPLICWWFMFKCRLLHKFWFSC